MNENEQYEAKPVIHGHFNEVTDIRWDPTFNMLFSCSHDETTRIFSYWEENKTWNEINRPQVHGYPINSLACINLGKNNLCKIISASEEKVLRMFNAPFNLIKFLKELTKKEINFKNDNTNEYYEKKYKNVEGSKQALGLMNREVILEDLDDEKESNFDYSKFDPDAILTNKSEQVYVSEYNYKNPPDEDFLSNNTLWPEEAKMYGHGNEIYTIDISHDGKYLASGQKAQEVVADNEKKNEIIKLFVNYYNNQSAKKTDMNNNASMQKNNNQSSYMNKLNKNNLNNDQKNLNNISQNENYLNNNNLLNKNKMLNKSNNSDQNQSRPNMNIENMNNNESSDFSGEIPNANISGNNIYFNKIQHSPKLLNQNIYNNLISETNNPNAVFNVEIPIVMGNKNKVHYKSGNRALSNFFTPKTNSIPVLNLDMNDKTFQLELEINELNSHITEIEKESKKIEEEIRKDEEEINKKKNDLEKKGERLKQSNNDILKCNQELENLKKTQEEILSQIPEGKVYKGSNKNGNKKLLKFSLNEIDDTEMFKILNKDLLDYQMYKTEIIRRQNIVFQIENRINEIKTIIKNLADNYDVQIYGSYALDLNMDWSDIDLILIRNDNQENNDNNNNNNDDNILIEQPNANELQNDNISVANTDSTRDTLLLNPINNNVNQINDTNILDYLSQAISHLNWVRSVKIRENLEVKILRAECILVNQNDSKKLDIDISVKTEKHFGLECVDLINTYLKEYSVLKPITIALRAILHSANLHLPEKGGLSAYGLILMVVSYIQSQKENFTKNEPYLCGKIFYGFLRHYGIMFDFNKYLILTYTGNESNGYNNTTDKDTLNLNQYGQEFIILDPLNNKNNVASNSFQFMNLKMAFMIAYMVTKEDCDCGCHFGEAEFENSFQSTEHCYLKRMLNSVRRFQG